MAAVAAAAAGQSQNGNGVHPGGSVDDVGIVPPLGSPAYDVAAYNPEEDDEPPPPPPPPMRWRRQTVARSLASDGAPLPIQAELGGDHGPEEEPLEPGWMEFRDVAGARYYFNESLNAASWIRPCRSNLLSSSSPSPAVSPVHGDARGDAVAAAAASSSAQS